MQAEQLAPNRFRLDITDEEFRVIIGALGEICFVVDGFEFEARLGVEPERAKEMAREIRRQADESGLEL